MFKFTAHNIKSKWNALTGILLAFALIFSASSFANAANYNTDYQSTLISANLNYDTQTVDDKLDDSKNVDRESNCCTDDDDTPCESNDCDIPCMSFNVPFAVLAPSDNLLHAQNTVMNAPNYTITKGISVLLNAPPPRA